MNAKANLEMHPKKSKSGRSPISAFFYPKKQLFKVEACQLNLKNASNIQTFLPKIPKIGQNTSKKIYAGQFYSIILSGRFGDPYRIRRAADLICIQETSR